MNDTLTRPEAERILEEGPSVPGIVAAAVWAIGLALGLSALIAGHPVAAIMGLMAPWLGLGWIEHTRAVVSKTPNWSSAGRSVVGPAVRVSR